MANRYPLIANSTADQIQEIASGDFLDLNLSGIVNSGNITVVPGNYFIGNGSQLTGVAATTATALTNGTTNLTTIQNGNITITIAGTPNVAVWDALGQYITGQLNVTGNITANNISTSGNIIPTANSVYTLGNATNNWSELYLSGNSLYIGGDILSTSSGNLLFNGNVLATVNGTAVDHGAAPENWNTLVNIGTYSVNYVSWGGTTGTPVDSSVYVGLLSVLTSGSITTQTFYPGTVTPTDAKIQWDRTLYSGTWTAWYKIINDFQVVDAGTY